MAPGADAAEPPATGTGAQETFLGTLEQARRLRNYLLRSKAASNAKLVAAILPFDESGRSAPEDRQRLYVAFQAAYEEAQSVTDPQTLSEVLAGRSPYLPKTRREKIGNGVLVCLGIVLTVMALSYSYWANRAVTTLDKIDGYLEFDHRATVLRLMEMESFFEDSVGKDPPYGSDEPIIVYNEVRDALRSYYNLEFELPQELYDLIEFNTPLDIIWSANVERFCYDVPETGASNLLQSTLCARQAASYEADQAVGPAAAEADQAAGMEADRAAAAAPAAAVDAEMRQISSAPAPAPAPASAGGTSAVAGTDHPQLVLRTAASRFLDRRNDVMAFAGRRQDLFSDVQEQRYILAQRAEQLRGILANVQNWWLPTIYGALGAVVYCMWRTLNPHVAPLGYLDGGMRIAFAALAGLTLSLLLVPSQMTGLGATPQRPLVYLIAFVFGYSIEAFVATLNRLNTAVSKKMSVTAK